MVKKPTLRRFECFLKPSPSSAVTNMTIQYEFHIRSWTQHPGCLCQAPTFYPEEELSEMKTQALDVAVLTSNWIEFSPNTISYKGNLAK